MMIRRGFIGALALLLAVGLLVVLPGGGSAQQKVAKIGMSFPLTGADADSADSITKGAQLAIDDINAKGGVSGYKLESIIFDSATPAAGQYDPAQAATNIRKFIADAAVVALIGPQMSGEGKATSPILSEADLATITPSSTNPDITDPKFQAQYRPKGKAVYFRTVTTDAYQGPNMANHAFHNLKVKKVYILDDSGAFRRHGWAIARLINGVVVHDRRIIDHGRMLVTAWRFIPPIMWPRMIFAPDDHFPMPPVQVVIHPRSNR